MRQLHWQDWKLLAQALVLLPSVRLGLRCLSFRTLDRILGRIATGGRWCAPTVARGSGDAAGARDPAELPYPERAAWAVGAVAKRILRTRPCLTQALVLRLMLQRHGLPAVLQIGVSRGDDGAFSAHAWLESDGRVLIGGQDARRTYPHSMALDDAAPVPLKAVSSSGSAACRGRSMQSVADEPM